MTKPKKLLISLHGIRTRGEWQKGLSPFVSERAWKYYPLDYGFFHAARLLVPPLRMPKIAWFREQVSRIKAENPNLVPSIIVHSFGSLILAECLKRFPDLTFDKIVLTGSIIHPAFDWKPVFDNGQCRSVLNLIGGSDLWSKSAHTFVIGAGHSGAKGFHNPSLITQKEYAHFAHGDAHYPEIFKGQVIPFLEDVLPVGSSYRDHISTVEAAAWSAATYIRQFVDRFEDAVRERQFIETIPTPSKLVVLIPSIASDATKYGREQLCRMLGLERIAFGSARERTALMGPDGTVYDLPSLAATFGILEELPSAKGASAYALDCLRIFLDTFVSENTGGLGCSIEVRSLDDEIRKHTTNTN
jgi:hypothetical protein